MIAPIIHINGSSADTLLDQIQKVTSALLGVLRAMQEAHPNGRDYDPKPGLYREAEREHLERVAKIQAIHKEYIEMGHAILDQTE
jgi:hypothetical protein